MAEANHLCFVSQQQQQQLDQLIRSASYRLLARSFSSATQLDEQKQWKEDKRASNWLILLQLAHKKQRVKQRREWRFFLPATTNFSSLPIKQQQQQPPVDQHTTFSIRSQLNVDVDVDFVHAFTQLNRCRNSCLTHTTYKYTNTHTAGSYKIRYIISLSEREKKERTFSCSIKDSHFRYQLDRFQLVMFVVSKIKHLLSAVWIRCILLVLLCAQFYALKTTTKTLLWK